MKWWANLVIRRPMWVLAAGVLLVAAAGAWGVGVFGHLSSGGFDDPSASSYKALNLITKEFPHQHTDVVVLFTSHNGPLTDPKVAAVVKADVAKIRNAAGVTTVTDWFTVPVPALLSRDSHQTYTLVSLDGSLSKQTDTYRHLKDLVPGSAGVQVQYGGQVAINDQINHQTSEDLAKAEALSFPILGILLLLIFRSVVAALVPLILGGLSILVAFLLVRTLTLFTDVSIYAINIITLMGLGLSIDYSLFIVSRFREELATGADVPKALATTLRTAGRTVLFSGLTVILSLLGLLVFKQGFLRSMGLGGAAAVAATVILSATVLPAILRLLGRRINALGLPHLSRSLDQPAKMGFWYRYSHIIMRYPLVVLGVAVELLVIIALPFMSAHFTTADASAVPKNLSSRQVNDALEQNFIGASQSPVTIVVHTATEASDPVTTLELTKYVQRLQAVSGVSTAAISGQNGRYSEIKATLAYEPQSRAAGEVLRDLRAVAKPAGSQVETGGQTAVLADLIASLLRQIPWAALIIVLTTSTLLFLMLGTIVIPIKAIILNILSLSAAFGLLVWVFQEGHLAKWLGLLSNGSLDATQPVLIFAIAFGLAMDYELFLLSRIKEEYDRTGDNAHSVAYGIQHTAGIITSAALALVTVIALFATGKISIIQQVGIGLAAAVAIDATIVRMVIVPAAMRLLGHWNWWAPKPLAAVARRLGLRES
ncbi:MAG TPA: MMPL family transporter [Candidatus Saccharimonadia bacterium]|nr:MMPL family transporter [Candidatus Saccharimonadia bacterium]